MACALLALAAPAGAQQAVRDTVGDFEGPPPRSLDVGAKLGGGVGPTAGFAFAGIDVGYRLLPSFVLGGYAQSTLVAKAMSEDRCRAGGPCEPPGFQRFGARGELHLVPSFVVDPWAAVGAGGLVVEGEIRPELMVEGGVDFRPSPLFAAGAFIALAPGSGTGDWDATTAVGMRFTLSFDVETSARVAGASHGHL